MHLSTLMELSGQTLRQKLSPVLYNFETIKISQHRCGTRRTQGRLSSSIISMVSRYSIGPASVISAQLAPLLATQRFPPESNANPPGMVELRLNDLRKKHSDGQNDDLRFHRYSKLIFCCAQKSQDGGSGNRMWGWRLSQMQIRGVTGQL